ncbi:hypothetical protein COM34_27315 [Bacillus wiedmannii]|uniref:metalloprotease family protein n=1 Tax=Bacillus wiedmannii TaxID=1890302 RepID=UPI000BF64DF9|nr:metalloprotease family protein [Bacillus wiedmannii]PGD03053.1 hypothetical protein COM34_27315 [Bacillus wiedmannii]
MQDNDWVVLEELDYTRKGVKFTFFLFFIIVIAVGVRLGDNLGNFYIVMTYLAYFLLLEIPIHEMFHKLGGQLFLKVDSEINLKFPILNKMFRINLSQEGEKPTHPYCKPKEMLSLGGKIIYALSPFLSFLLIWGSLIIITNGEKGIFFFALTVSIASCNGDFWAVCFSIKNKLKYKNQYKQIKFEDKGDSLAIRGKKGM